MCFPWENGLYEASVSTELCGSVAFGGMEKTGVGFARIYGSEQFACRRRPKPVWSFRKVVLILFIDECTTEFSFNKRIVVIFFGFVILALLVFHC